MKKMAVALVVSAMMLGSTAYAANMKNTGCGLGTLVFADAPFGETTLGQVFIVTTNGTSGNQTFGITSGTSNCEQPTNFVKNERLNEFVVANMDNLARDIAMGSGESLDTMAELIELPKTERPQLYAKLQANFTKIYTSDTVEAAEVVDNIYTVIQ